MNRQLIFAREFAIEEEKFYQDQLMEGIRHGYFNQSAIVSGEARNAVQSNTIRLNNDVNMGRLISSF